MEEEVKMFARKSGLSSVGRAAALATVAAVALTGIEPSMAFAGGATQGRAAKGVIAGGTVASAAQAGGVTDISARRRHYSGGGAAAAAAFAGIVGTGLAIAAAQNQRAYYDDYYGGPAYYAPGPYYYGGGPYYYGGYRSGVPYVRGHPLAGW
jgi:hypothetical protein